LRKSITEAHHGAVLNTAGACNLGAEAAIQPNATVAASPCQSPSRRPRPQAALRPISTLGDLLADSLDLKISGSERTGRVVSEVFVTQGVAGG
jgi:hypothetical protein